MRRGGNPFVGAGFPCPRFLLLICAKKIKTIQREAKRLPYGGGYCLLTIVCIVKPTVNVGFNVFPSQFVVVFVADDMIMK